MRRKKILIIEDESDVATYLEILFQDEGYDTIIANDGMAGYNLAKQEKPDLITLDITMPVQSRIRTYSRLKNDPQLMHIPVVIVTAVRDSMDDLREEFKGLPNPEGFMSKPILPTRLFQVVKQILNPENLNSKSPALPVD